MQHQQSTSSYGLSSQYTQQTAYANGYAAAPPTPYNHLYSQQQYGGVGSAYPQAYHQSSLTGGGVIYPGDQNSSYGYYQGVPQNYYAGGAAGGVQGYWNQQQAGTPVPPNSSYSNYGINQGASNQSAGALSASSSQTLQNQISQSQSANQTSQQNHNLQPEVVTIDSSSSAKDISEIQGKIDDSERNKSTSKWGAPIQTQEIDNFRMMYMPWFKLFAPTNLQNKQSDTQVEQFPAAAAAMKLSVKCPDKLSSYIERAFQKCINQQERDFMDGALKRICNACKQRGTLLNKDWDALQVPSLPREGPNYTIINARLENMDTVLPQNQQSSLQNKTANLNQQSVYQSIQLQPQSQLSKLSSASPLQLNKNNSLNNNNNSPFTINKQPLLSNKTSGGSSIFVNNQGDQVSEVDLLKRKQRLEKFNTQLSAPSMGKQSLIGGSSNSASNKHSLQSQYSANDFDANDLDALTKHLAIKGTCTRLEKSYFRLTSAPDPSEVRPEDVLKKSLKILLQKWKNKETDYKYVDDQFRSIRQDLTVQRLENEFCVKVYEAHARIALECSDLDQFNQCQTQLHYLYRQGNQGHRIEFLAYKILYQVFCEMDAEVLKMLKTLTFEEKMCEPIQHALKVRQSLASGNFGRFFKLYRVAPNMGGYLMDVFIERYRILNLQKVALAYIAGNIELGYLSFLFAFDEQSHAEKFLTGLGCKIARMEDQKKYLMCKDSLPAIKKAPLKVKVCVK